MFEAIFPSSPQRGHRDVIDGGQCRACGGATFSSAWRTSAPTDRPVRSATARVAGASSSLKRAVKDDRAPAPAAAGASGHRRRNSYGSSSFGIRRSGVGVGVFLLPFGVDVGVTVGVGVRVGIDVRGGVAVGVGVRVGAGVHVGVTVGAERSASCWR
jgi:hypothetical protein